jgi:hypothetical protein
MRDDGLRRIVLGAAELSPEARQQVAERVDELRRAEHSHA